MFQKRAGGYEAQFARTHPALGRLVLRSAVAGDRRSAVLRSPVGTN
jgi:hypothetical protein